MSELMEEQKPLPKEVMFLMSDVELLQTMQSELEISDQVEDIWKTYFICSDYGKLYLSNECFEEAKEIYSKGRPYPTNIYNRACKELFEMAISGTLWVCLRNFATASLYKSRVSKKDVELPDELYFKMTDELDDSHWYAIQEKNGIVLSRHVDKSSKGFFFKSYCEINCPASEAIDLVWDPPRRKEFQKTMISSQVLEQFGPRSLVVQQVGRVMGKLADGVNFQHRRIMPNGAISIMVTSVDHPLAPEKPGVQRVEVNLVCYVVQPTGESTCAFTVYYQLKMKHILSFFSNFDWFYVYFAKSFKRIKTVLEGKVKEKESKECQIS